MKTKNLFFSSDDAIKRIKELEFQLRNLTNTLNNYFVKGRLRTDRAAPANSDEILSSDKLYDLLINQDYIYTIIDDSGNLKWRRVVNSSF